MEDILEEAANLAAEGIKELIVVAQDTTNYGRDIYGKRCLPMLLEKLAQLPIPMIRILYLYPSDVEEDLLQVMAAHDNICNYLDIPIQHGDNVILAAMNRRGTKELFVEKIAMIRRYLPDVMLRTTVIVGFPGETADNFANLLDFLQQARFDWVGAFPYFQEDDTPAAIFDVQVPPEIKQSRLDQVMEQAAQITAEKLAQWPGRMVSVLAEDTAVTADGCYEGRSYGQAPEVDG
ncbi:MAG: radical SAM protein, partial [Clostridiales bacterium]